MQDRGFLPLLPIWDEIQNKNREVFFKLSQTHYLILPGVKA